MKWLMLSLLLLVPQVAAAAATATLDRQISNYGESVLLHIKVDGSVDEDPDFSVLEKDFDILNQSQSSNYSMINGSISRSKQWQLNLMPKRTGTITIPEIHFGNVRTQSLLLRVLKPSHTGNHQSDRDIYLEVTPSAKEVYVQAQLLLTVKLFRAVNLAQAELSEPEIAQVVVKKLGEDKSYETVVNQRRFVVTERRYALFPSEAGQLIIPALQFDGRLVAGGRSMFGQQPGRVVRVASQPLKVQVLAKPDAWDKTKPWLPAKALSLRELWTDGQSTTYKVGEPLTRTIELRGTGLTAAHLPALFKAEDVDGFKQYPDQPKLLAETAADGLIGIRQEKVALIPTRAGELKLPGVSVSWWNTETNEVQSMLIPARMIEVLPADKAAAPQPPVAQPMEKQAEQRDQEAESSVTKSAADEQAKVAAAGDSGWWQGLALFFALAWLMTLAAWWHTARNKRSAAVRTEVEDDKSSLKPMQKALETACKQHDAKKVMQLLPQWGALAFAEEKVSHLGQLKGRAEALDAAIEDLEKHLYARGQQGEWSGDSMLKAVSEIKPEQAADKSKKGLKPLYSYVPIK